MDFISMISGAIGGAVSAGVFKGPVQTLQDWWYINFGYTLSEKAAFLQEQQKINVEMFRDSTLKKIAQISPEKIQEPKLYILGPALEASRYFIEEEVLREMFANLIASSMDKDMDNIIHPSYVEVIKQLSPQDAIFIHEFKSKQRLAYGNICFLEKKKNIRHSRTEESDKFKLAKLPPFPSSFEEFEKEFASKSRPFIDYFYYSLECQNIDHNEFSISSLERAGLISIKRGIKLIDPAEYKEIDHAFKELSITLQDQNRIPDEFELHLEKGVIDLSPFGKSFFYSCV